MAQHTRTASISVSGTSQQVADHRWGKRLSITITNTSAAAVVSINKGETPAVAGEGIVKQPTGVFSESTDSGYRCWQGPVQVVATIAGTIAISETFED